MCFGIRRNEEIFSPRKLPICKFRGMVYDRRLFNILQIGIGFMLIFTSFQSCGMVQSIVIESFIRHENATNLGGLQSKSGYIGLAIIYGSFTISNFLSNPVIARLGPKLSMPLAAITYGLYLASFLYLHGWLLYLCSALLGFGAAVLWASHGNYITLNSDDSTIGRHAGIVWALFQSSFLFGSCFLYIQFRGQEIITSHTRFTVYVSFTVVCAMGIVVLALLRTPPRRDSKEKDETHIFLHERGMFCAACTFSWLCSVKTFKFLAKRDLQFLAVTFTYSGLEMSFLTGVYGTCVANTKHFGSDSNALLGLSGMFIGAGEIIGGATFGVFGHRTIRYSRIPIVLLGLATHWLAFILIFVNIPAVAPQTPTYDIGHITSNKYLAIFCSFCLGFADSCWSTQIFATLGSLFAHDSAPAFALFMFFQALAASTAFFYTTALLLHWQLLILAVVSLCAAVAFCRVELGVMKRRREHVTAQHQQ